MHGMEHEENPDVFKGLFHNIVLYPTEFKLKVTDNGLRLGLTSV